jgi:hypothetical protein
VRRSGRPAATGERGTGLIGTIAGTTTFLLLLSVALQLLLQLLAASTVHTAAYEAARSAATADRPLDAATLAAAEDHARSVLGDLGDRATFDWDTTDPDAVQLTISTSAPHFLAPVVSGALGWERIERRAVVRREAARP